MGTKNKELDMTDVTEHTQSSERKELLYIRSKSILVYATGDHAAPACGLFGSQPGVEPLCPLHWKSQPLYYQGSPSICYHFRKPINIIHYFMSLETLSTRRNNGDKAPSFVTDKQNQKMLLDPLPQLKPLIGSLLLNRILLKSYRFSGMLVPWISREARVI